MEAPDDATPAPPLKLLGPDGQSLPLTETPANGAGGAPPASADASAEKVASPAPAPPRQVLETRPLARGDGRERCPLCLPVATDAGTSIACSRSPESHFLVGEAPPKFEREAPVLVQARAALWRTVRLLDAELEEAEAARSMCDKPSKPLAKFTEMLRAARRTAAALHATAYVNTLEERYDAINPLVVDAQVIAQRAGIKVGR